MIALESYKKRGGIGFESSRKVLRMRVLVADHPNESPLDLGHMPAVRVAPQVDL